MSFLSCARCKTEFEWDHPARRYCKPCMSRYTKVRTAASAAVKHQIRTGKLPKPSTRLCADCGKAAQCYDHRDYSKPLDVAPVCSACNHKRGPATWNGCRRKGRRAKPIKILRTDVLSARESEVVKLLRRRVCVTRIARRLDISVKTVSTLKARAINKGAIVEAA